MTAIDICVPNENKGQWLSQLVLRSNPKSWWKCKDQGGALSTESSCDREFSNLVLHSKVGTFHNPDVRLIGDLDKEDYEALFDTSIPWGSDEFDHEVTD